MATRAVLGEALATKIVPITTLVHLILWKLHTQWALQLLSLGGIACG